MAASANRQMPHSMLLLQAEHKDGDCYSIYIRSDYAVPSALHKKMPSVDYAEAVQRGRRLLVEIARSPSSTNPSPWTTFSSLAIENWKHQHFGNAARFEPDSDTDIPLPAAAPNDHKNVFGSKTITWRHNANGGAFYAQYYHPAGAIFATGLRSPLNAPLREGQTQRERLPKLQHWSDVTFLQWAELTDDAPRIRKGLKKVVHCDVTNPLTLKIIHEVLGAEVGKDFPYPGRVFTPEGQGEAFVALLGTPNGIGTGHLLAEHKEQLGWMEVSSIQLYTEISWYLVVNVQQRGQ